MTDISSSSRPIPSSSTTKSIAPSPRQPKRKPQAENWDDDFEFTLPKLKDSSAVNIKTIPKRQSRETIKSKGKGRISPVESFVESWDDSPPARAVLTSSPRKSAPAPLVLTKGIGLDLNPPRLSPSRTSPLPSPGPSPHPFNTTNHSSTPKSATSTTKPLLSTSTSRVSLGKGLPESLPTQDRSGSNATIRNKLVKRHPSTSFAPVPTTKWNESNSSLSSLGFSPNDGQESSNVPPPLPRSKSGEQMPPPPVPGLVRTKSKNQRNVSTREVRVSGIPFSPSQEAMNGDKKRGFWKRLSGAQSAPHGPDQRRRRSSSVGIDNLICQPDLIPPLPSNTRSPSAASAKSNITSTSSTSASSRPISTAITSLLRRSSSNLSGPKQSPKSPPSSYPFSPSPMQSNSQTPDLPPLPTSHSFSRGLHLPSPTPGSPYHPTSIPPITYPLASSTSLPGHKSDEDTETDDGTPRRRQRIRPVSALPAPRSTSKWAEPLNGFPSDSTLRRDDKITPYQFLSEIAPSPSMSDMNGGTGLATSTSSTLRRLGSLSKKHGRKISGGWKFGTGSSSSSGGSTRIKEQTLETVLASPQKLPLQLASGSSPSSPMSPPSQSPERHNSISRSMFILPTHDSIDDRDTSKDTVKSTTDAMIASRKADKERRRKSWNDFVVPRGVLDKQKELKERIGAVKMFAGGVQSLKTLLEDHATLRLKVFESGTQEDYDRLELLEQEYGQWWEMATVLIEVASTGETAPSKPGSPRSRRVTMTDESDLSSKVVVTASPDPTDPMDDLVTVFGEIKLSDPSATTGMRAKRASWDVGSRETPDNWRASTGRQDLSRRQLEVLRGMLRTPMSKGSEQTTSPEAGSPGLSPPSHNRIRPSLSPRESSLSPGISLPSPGDSTYITTSGSFPSPSTAGIANPNLSKRRASKVGLAGLKEFLKSLKGQSRYTATRPTPQRSKSFQSTQSQQLTKTNESPPDSLSPSQTSSTNLSKPRGSYDEIFYPTSRTSFSAFRPPPVITRQTSPIRRSGYASPLESPDLDSENHKKKRPSLKSIFRTSSGNWSDLVRSSPSSQFSSSTPGVPKGSIEKARPLSRSSSRKSSNSVTISVPSREVSMVDGLPHSSYRSRTANPSPDLSVGQPGIVSGILRKSSMNGFKMPTKWGGGEGRGGKTPTSTTFTLPSLPSLSSVPSSPARRVTHGYGVDAQGQGIIILPINKSPKRMQLAKARGLNTSASMGSDTAEFGIMADKAHGTVTNVEASEQTLRPARKSRIAGLGRPDSPAAEVYRSDTPGGSVEGKGEDEFIGVVLTPENLPTLLEYLKQCQAKLGEWKERSVGLVVE